MNLFSYLAYPPILRGFLVLLFAGALFPLSGVFVLRLNLITLRFMLMHGTLLGGAIALGVGVEPLYLSLGLNVALIFLVSRLSQSTGLNLGHVTTFFMVLTVGLALAIMYRFNVPAKDTLAILWGNLYAMSEFDVLLTVLFLCASLGFVLATYGKLKAIIFDREVAFSTGIPDKLLYSAILVLTGMTIAFAMKLIGALLLDALLLLPAIVASFFAKSTKQMFLTACIIGLFSAFVGFLLSLALDIPASSAVTLVSASVLGVGAIIHKYRRIR